MSKLFKYLKPYAASIAAIVAILIVQAFCDLSLPAYTSDIVNVGIQQGGIDDKIPQALREEDMDKLLLFMSEEDAAVVKQAYELKSTDTGYDYDGAVYVLDSSKKEDEETVDKLVEIMGKPMLLTSGFESDSDMTKQMEDSMKENMKSAMEQQAQAQMEAAQSQMTDEQKAMLAANPEAAQKQQEEAKAKIDAQLKKIDDADAFQLLEMIPDEQRSEITENISKGMADMPETMVEQAATAYIKTAYKNLGVNTNSIQYKYILTTGAKMIGLAFLGMAASVLVGFLASRVAASTGRDLRGRVFKRVVGFSNGEFDKFSTASLITRSTNDIQQIQMLVVMLLRMVLYAPIIAAGGIFKVFHTNVDMSWIIAVAVGLILLIVIVLFTTVMPKFKILQNLVDKLNLVTREILTGLPVIRAFSTEKYEEGRFDSANKNLMKTQLFVNRAMTFMMPAMMLVMNGISVLIVWTGAHGINDGQMQVGDMMAFIQYTMQIIMAFLMICMISIMLPRAAVSANRVDEVLTSKTAIRDPENPAHVPESGKGEVVFDHVSFRYPQAEEDVLHDISFTARPGQTTAIIGSTGSGKSTMINLIPRFYDVSEGKITLDGMDVRDISQHELREKLGYVPQKGVLFSGTIASNIMYGNPDGSDAEMVEAAEIAQATEFIEEKRKKYDSPIAQGGSNVSGGQKQRLSIARAIAKKPDVFIFDDSFSALDYKTDITLRTALKQKTQDSTVIIVAQRISTILHAEQIIVLDEGKVAGIGTHKELLKSCEAYYQIAASQLSEAELADHMGNDRIENDGKGEADYE
ncbi:ABC transporter ATP-binding protein/permease [Bariatricus massiliensis]|uniref:ABC transporter ATP-binding protein/permease n=1 Tax=Bariatricus massiliensis TaxID=1745713 RepID=A0ABS8DJT0_9FIRM|nr:ABC transporter ATP-binding protein [Bariatricus massiliensis]MCB7305286.1 ABC transporter ATP-binding protein/permease [Bariatricus massiliensis]MCB7375821.1 ABC transporter ATP-binding protein/permease [Bariatricus massiliensis]MCB7388429.1 ABC transporter ATP-binding protein/permease [Bariatricus massiliensis]MCB7412583.1 ABC transporter ATP-binding protein/permease [Bariatricus massiliensis]MCQ5254779.1 ABC transporter ATP-binding protein/permease [Bariatricus massiliensis]